MGTLDRIHIGWPPAWADTIIRARHDEPAEARVRAHTGLFVSGGAS